MKGTERNHGMWESNISAPPHLIKYLQCNTNLDLNSTLSTMVSCSATMSMSVSHSTKTSSYKNKYSNIQSLTSILHNENNTDLKSVLPHTKEESKIIINQ